MKNLICIFLSLSLLTVSCSQNSPVDSPVAENLDNVIRIEQAAENQPAIFMPDGSRERLENFRLPITREMAEALEKAMGMHHVSDDDPERRSKIAAVDIPSFKLGGLLFRRVNDLVFPGPAHCLIRVPEVVMEVIDLATGAVVGRIHLEFLRDGLDWIMLVFADGKKFPGPNGLGECWSLRGSSPDELVKEIKVVVKTVIIPALYEYKEEILIGVISIVFIALVAAYLAPLIVVEGAVVGGSGLVPFLIKGY